MGPPVSGRDCVLPQSEIVTKTFPPSGGFGSWPSCGVPYLRLALCSSTCVSPGGCPSFYQVWSCAFVLGSSSQGLVCGGASNVGFSSVFLRDVVTLWVKRVFLSLLIANVGLHRWLFLSDVANSFGVESSSSSVLLRLLGTSCGWWPHYCLACHFSLTVDCLLLASSAA